MDEDKKHAARESVIRELAKLGVTLEELDQGAAELAERMPNRIGGRDNRICACGHRMSAHRSYAGRPAVCQPTRLVCPCKNPRPVAEAEDTRCFNFKTEGEARHHALWRGIRACAERGKEFRWTAPLICDRCKSEAERLVPVPVSQRGVRTPHATGYDALLCEECSREV
jgi:hypothetical protein